MKVTLSQDILGICLLLSGGDLNLKLDEIATLAGEFQEKNDRHFGITRDDFRNLLIRLVWEQFPGSIFDNLEHFGNVMLKEVALKMLSYGDVYCNDEGEYWTEGCTGEYYIQELFNGDVDAYLDKLSAKKLLVEFFQNLHGENSSVKEMSELMVRAKITGDILYTCSRAGDSS